MPVNLEEAEAFNSDYNVTSLMWEILWKNTYYSMGKTLWFVCSC